MGSDPRILLTAARQKGQMLLGSGEADENGISRWEEAGMLTVAAIQNVLQTAVPEVQFVRHDFAAEDPADCTYVRVIGGSEPAATASVLHPGVQLMVRAEQPEIAEEQANRIFRALHGKREFQAGTVRVIHSLAKQNAPVYTGKDEQGRTLYLLHFVWTIPFM